ncbi:hypothetical protein [Belnapia moabensis]|uniref:hypothetical protein n=1 Tax=Belnapia moabensis TaxID=365533 RepID=UPI0012ED6295|nr:hypothetical protein [Belnapia moabensis]
MTKPSAMLTTRRGAPGRGGLAAFAFQASLLACMDTFIVDPRAGYSFYRMTRAAWAAPFALRTSAKHGTRAFNQRAEALMRQIAQSNDSEPDTF